MSEQPSVFGSNTQSQVLLPTWTHTFSPESSQNLRQSGRSRGNRMVRCLTAAANIVLHSVSKKKHQTDFLISDSHPVWVWLESECCKYWCLWFTTGRITLQWMMWRKSCMAHASPDIILDSLTHTHTHMRIPANRELIKTASTHLDSLKHFTLCDISSWESAAYTSGSQKGFNYCTFLIKFKWLRWHLLT